MGWIVIIVLAYAPIIYKINKQLASLDERISNLEYKIKHNNQTY